LLRTAGDRMTVLRVFRYFVLLVALAARERWSGARRRRSPAPR
jgi:hypothetical protein